MLTVIKGNHKPVRELPHGLVIPGFDAKLCGLNAAKIHKGKLFWPGCDRIVENAATENEILLHNGRCLFFICILFFLDPIVSQDKVQLLNNIRFPAKWIYKSDVNTCFRVKISVLFVKHHMQLLVS